MWFRKLVLGLTGFLVGGMVGIGAGLLGAPMPGDRTRQVFLSETRQLWGKAFPAPRVKCATASRGMKREINWRAGQFEWIRQDERDEQRS